MAIVGITPSKVRDYVSVQERDQEPPVEKPVIWKIGSIDSLSMAKINDEFIDIGFSQNDGETSGKINSLRFYAWAVEVCRHGLKGWENFKDADGNDIEFKTQRMIVFGSPRQVVSPDSLGMIPIEVIQELAQEIKGANSVTEKEVKNSVAE